MGAALNRPGIWTRVRALWIAIALAFALLLTSSPAFAHQDHKKKQAEAAQMMQQGALPGASMTMNGMSSATHAPGNEVMDGMDMGMDRSKMSFFERLVDWFGRLHPMVVHFPIAFFPAALITAIAGRRKPAFSAPVQFLVVAGGISRRSQLSPAGSPGLAPIPSRSSPITVGWASRSACSARDSGSGHGAGRGKTAVPE